MSQLVALFLSLHVHPGPFLCVSVDCLSFLTFGSMLRYELHQKITFYNMVEISWMQHKLREIFTLKKIVFLKSSQSQADHKFFSTC